MEYQHEDYTNHYTNLDQTYNYWFVDDDLMFFDCGLIDHELRSMNKDLVPNTLNIDTVSVSQGLSLCLDDSGGGLLSEGLEGFPKENRDDGDSFVTKTRIRRDRSKTLVSERKRRGRMKEKLYELRSLVPNITKMDKASIIADAVEYVNDLKSQVKNMEKELLILETSLKSDQVPQNLLKNTMRNTQLEEAIASPHGAKILRLNTTEVGDQRFFFMIECENKDASDRFVLSLTINVEEFDEEIEASTMKLWVMGALLKEGFEFEGICIS
uniref:BHLH domain-containing protein n=1 Tax=Ananas comosus var. bracteatus TaxID=296719 RepID=A0A6V7Q089_ANACO|nr:unnamed protein product [Ananas comosus var. bracteatus]